MDIALFQPDIPQNTGTILRLGACVGARVHIIEPAGFPFSERALKRSGMDYVSHVDLVRHIDWASFDAWRKENGQRLVLLTTKAKRVYTNLTYRKDDILLCGNESSGAPDIVHRAATERVTIPLQGGMRSLNVAVAVAMVLGEGLRQTDSFPVAAKDETGHA